MPTHENTTQQNKDISVGSRGDDVAVSSHTDLIQSVMRNANQKTLTPTTIMQMQSTWGNHATTQFIQRTNHSSTVRSHKKRGREDDDNDESRQLKKRREWSPSNFGNQFRIANNNIFSSSSKHGFSPSNQSMPPKFDFGVDHLSESDEDDKPSFYGFGSDFESESTETPQFGSSPQFNFGSGFDYVLESDDEDMRFSSQFGSDFDQVSESDDEDMRFSPQFGSLPQFNFGSGFGNEHRIISNTNNSFGFDFDHVSESDIEEEMSRDEIINETIFPFVVNHSDEETDSIKTQKLSSSHLL